MVSKLNTYAETLSRIASSEFYHIVDNALCDILIRQQAKLFKTT